MKFTIIMENYSIKYNDQPPITFEYLKKIHNWFKKTQIIGLQSNTRNV